MSGRVRRLLEAARSAHGAEARRPRPMTVGDGGFGSLTPEQQVEALYELLLHRPVDPGGMEAHLPGLASGKVSPAQLAEWITASDEWWTVTPFSEINASLHVSRSIFVRSLPAARRILDLGGTAMGAPQGAMVLMGYPHRFEELIVVDLPSEHRDDLYREQEQRDVIETHLGPVRYRYHSMADLSAYPDDTFDLVYSGQSIEHVPVEVADRVLAEVARVMRPDGFFALDTPNGPVCRLQQAQYLNPDHDYEYSHDEMVAKLDKAGFAVVEAKGLNWAGPSVEAGVFSLPEVATRRGIYADPQNCYLLAYVCRLKAAAS